MALVTGVVLECSASSTLHDHLHFKGVTCISSHFLDHYHYPILRYILCFSTVMSSIESDESDGYITCGSRASSIHHYVHWAPQHESDHQGQSSSHPQRDPTAATTPDAPGTDGSQRPIFRHLISRLKLGGFQMDPTLPAVFKADNSETTRYSVCGWKEKQEGPRKKDPATQFASMDRHTYVGCVRTFSTTSWITPTSFWPVTYPLQNTRASQPPNN